MARGSGCQEQSFETKGTSVQRGTSVFLLRHDNAGRGYCCYCSCAHQECALMMWGVSRTVSKGAVFDVFYVEDWARFYFRCKLQQSRSII